MKNRNVLSTGKVAWFCGVSQAVVAKWIDNGTLKGYRIPLSKDRRVTADELEKFMQEYGMPMEDFLKEYK